MATRGAAGFTLIEVVVAFVLLALVFSTGFRIFSEGLARAGALDERSQALEVARSQLADAGVEAKLEPGQSQGATTDQRYRWTTTIAATEEGNDPQHPVNSPFSLYRVDVKVDWLGGDAKDHSLALATLRIGVRQK